MSANTPEGKVKQKVREIFKAHGVHYTHIPANQFSKAGAPDYVCCIVGLYLAVEVKAGKGKLTELQKIEAEGVEKHGGKYVVVNEHRLKALEELIKAMSERSLSQAKFVDIVIERDFRE